MEQEFKFEILEKSIALKALVSSHRAEGAYYIVELLDGQWKCSCLDFSKKDEPAICKHIWFLKQEIL